MSSSECGNVPSPSERVFLKSSEVLARDVTGNATQSTRVGTLRISTISRHHRQYAPRRRCHGCAYQSTGQCPRHMRDVEAVTGDAIKSPPPKPGTQRRPILGRQPLHLRYPPQFHRDVVNLSLSLFRQPSLFLFHSCRRSRY